MAGSIWLHVSDMAPTVPRLSSRPHSRSSGPRTSALCCWTIRQAAPAGRAMPGTSGRSWRRPGQQAAGPGAAASGFRQPALAQQPQDFSSAADITASASSASVMASANARPATSNCHVWLISDPATWRTWPRCRRAFVSVPSAEQPTRASASRSRPGSSTPICANRPPGSSGTTAPNAARIPSRMGSPSGSAPNRRLARGRTGRRGRRSAGLAGAVSSAGRMGRETLETCAGNRFAARLGCSRPAVRRPDGLRAVCGAAAVP